ncbi:MAG: type II toxin-antitoxin system mRNA interferase toxin, RelE/StbE family [bacterium]|nr:type II toxin-antitoxin system mRNA interferase toxin, RelE/StbE family [bacterium]
MKVHITSEFEKSFHKLPVRIQYMAEKKDREFQLNPFDKRLHTHKLKGELEGYWSYYINYKYRILFRFLNENEVIYYDIGTHTIYR